MIEAYSNCGAHIRQALSDPNPATEAEAFSAVKSNVAVIQRFFNYSKDIANVSRELLRLIATGNERSSFVTYQLTVKQYGRILDFALSFDEIKMTRPGIQNDFSYYRRVLAKHSNDPDIKVG
jgi:hypothetical protein